MSAIEKLKEYKNKSDDINQGLREGIDNPDLYAIDELFSEIEVPSTLYRFLDNQYVKFDGEIFCDPAYLSCTDDIDNFICKVPTNHLACLIIKLDSPTSCIYVEELLPEFDGEGEYILPRSLKLQLVNDSAKVLKSMDEFDKFLEENNSYTGSEELRGARKIETISLYTLIKA